MAVSISVDLSALDFRSPSEMKKDIAKALRIFDTYYKHRVQQRFAAEGPGWPPRKDSAGASTSRQMHASALAEHNVKKKLIHELRRAQKRYMLNKASLKSVLRRGRLIQEFHKQVSGDQTPTRKMDRTLEKSVGKLRERVGREESRLAGRVLGRMAGAMKSKIRGAVLEVTNTIPWSAVQNEGGPVGNRATLPPRPFNYLDSDDADVFAEIVSNMVMLALA